MQEQKKKKNMMSAKPTLSAEELDDLHDAGADLSVHVETGAARRPGLEIEQVEVDFPKWMVRSLDLEAQRLGIPRQYLIKVWISQALEAKGPPVVARG